jgi:hypothetical protein
MAPVKAGPASLAVLLSGCSIERDIVFAKFECRVWFGAAGNGQPQPSLESEKVDEKSGLTVTEMVSAAILSWIRCGASQNNQHPPFCRNVKNFFFSDGLFPVGVGLTLSSPPAILLRRPLVILRGAPFDPFCS